MNKGLKNIIISEIVKRIPSNTTPVNYLMDLLGLSSESVYRRIRGDINFTFEEIAKLSLNLGLSIDELIGLGKTDRVFFDLVSNISLDHQESFSLLLNNYYNNLVRLRNIEDIESIIVMNHFFAFMTMGSDLLFRFFSYKWVHQTREVPLNYYFSDYTIPPEVVSIQNKIKYHTRLSGSSTIILDQDVFLNTMKSIYYYYKRELISKDELLALKNELKKVIDYTANAVYHGSSGDGVSYSYYLSYLNIDSNSIFTQYGEKMISHFWVYPVSPISVSNPEVCTMHKEWLNSLKKYSVLISQSNEIVQAEFFNKQYDYLEKMVNDDWL